MKSIFNLRNLNRRTFLGGAVALAILAATPTFADEKKPVVVVTSYSADATSRIEAAFEKAYPQYRIQIIWRMPNDALPYLLKPQQSGVDVYWSASPRTFARLKAENALRKLDIDSSQLSTQGLSTKELPAKIGQTQLRDADNFYIATEVAAYGFALNTAVLNKLGITAPKDWRDLTDSRFAGQIALPDPSKVGYAPVLIDILLQSYGWENGWALWSEISGQSALMGHGASFVGDDVGAGKYAVGLSIDFFVVSAIANGAPLTFSYPNYSGINPGHVAITASAPNSEGAKAFTEFVLSQQGQLILTHADIRKLPVLPNAYEKLDTTYYRPFEAAARGELNYDNDKGRNRLGIVTSLFNQQLGYRHDEQVTLWQQVKTLEKNPSAKKSIAKKQQKIIAQVRSILSVVPITETQAVNPELQKQFRDRVEGAQSSLSELEQSWRTNTDSRIATAKTLLEKLPL